MKVAFDHQVFSMQRYGGISRYIANLATALVGLEQDIKIFAPFYFNAYGKELPVHIIDGHYMKAFPRRTGRFFMAYNRFVTQRKISQWKPNIVHETYYARRSSNVTKSPTILTVHDMIHELFPESFYKRDKTTELKKEAVERAQHLICVSHNTKKDLIELFGINEEKISVVHLGIDQVKQKISLDVSIDKPYLLYVGHRGGYKNFQGFLKAFAYSNRLRKDFFILAFGSDKFSNEELKLIDDLGLDTKQVKHMLGSDEVLAALYQRAEAFIYPSLYEGFGIPPLEAMVNDCPVVSSNISSMPEVIGDAAIFFNPLSLEDMVMAIEKVVYNTECRSDLINKGQIRREQFTWKSCAQRTLTAYQQSL